MNQSEALKRGSKVNASCNLLYNINKENGYKKKRDCDVQSKCKCKRSAGEIASLIRVSCVLIRGETSVNSSSNVVWSIRKKFLKLGGSSVDNSFKRAWNDPNCGRLLIHGRTQQDLRTGRRLFRLLLIAPRKIIMHTAASMHSWSVRTILFWR